jgi:digeranylgeranylglycerophospholipid reductase
MSMDYDVVVIGAGPAGGHCAREVAMKGKKVLLVEKSKDFSVNNYSSGGAPAEFIKDYSLPETVIGTTWNKIALYTSSKSYEWKDTSYQGVVLDFMKLRTFLAEQVKQNGSEVLLNHAYHHHEERDGKTIVFLKQMQQVLRERFFKKAK